MSLVARVSLTGPPGTDPEDYLFSALSVIFPDDTTELHGDADHGVLYTTPHLPAPIVMSLTDPTASEDRALFSHFLWNAALLLAKLVEASTLAAADAHGRQDIQRLRGSGPVPVSEADAVASAFCDVATAFDVGGRATIEFGAGTALPSILAALLGATRVTVTDYPSDVVMANLRANVDRNLFAPKAEGETANPATKADVVVAGHAWGEFDSDVAVAGRRAYDCVLLCDCLWMDWQHDNLRASIAHFLRDTSDSRAWVVAGFHTGRPKVAAFFDADALAAADLVVESIWERDVADNERPWLADRGIEDKTERKRWMVVAILRRKSRST